MRFGRQSGENSMPRVDLADRFSSVAWNQKIVIATIRTTSCCIHRCWTKQDWLARCARVQVAGCYLIRSEIIA
jgi:hypothetical protein